MELLDGEEVFFETDDLIVTNSRVLTPHDSYVLRNITSTGIEEHTNPIRDKGRNAWWVGGWLLGFAAWPFVALANGLVSIILWAVALAMLVYGGRQVTFREYTLKVRTSAGEQALWTSTDEELTREAYGALNHALAKT